MEECRRIASEALIPLDIAKPPRPAAYSSLPPSPRREGDSSEAITASGAAGSVGLGIADVSVPGIQVIRSASDDLPIVPRVVSGDREMEGYLSEPETEEWWPARSRRNTLDGTATPFNTRSPRTVDDIDVFPTPESDHRRRSATFDSIVEAEQSILHGEPESPTSPTSPNTTEVPLDAPSLWALLKDEQGAEGWEGWLIEGKWERIQNFLAVPLAVERVSLSAGQAHHRLPCLAPCSASTGSCTILQFFLFEPSSPCCAVYNARAQCRRRTNMRCFGCCSLPSLRLCCLSLQMRARCITASEAKTPSSST